MGSQEHWLYFEPLDVNYDEEERKSRYSQNKIEKARDSATEPAWALLGTESG